MKIPSLLTVTLLIAGCTSMQPIDGSPADLRLHINSGELLKTGDRVLIVTTDGTTHRFTVKSAGAGRIDGASESIRLEQISALKKRQFSRGKTIALVGGLLGGASLGLFIYGFAEYAGAFALR